ncbi:MAG: hypothetical protein AAGC56_08780 [Pseudomonadota bacterium]
MFTFLIPIRHPERVRDADLFRQYLLQTFASLEAQTASDWRAILVANEGHALPDLPDRASVHRVDFAPPKRLSEAETPTEYERLLREDKGRRLTAGIKDIPPDALVMLMDDDDWISAKLVEFCLNDQSWDGGYYVFDGYVRQTGADAVTPVSEFQGLCGSSIIVRPKDLMMYDTGAFRADDESIIELGDHLMLFRNLGLKKGRLRPIPFPSAVYRVGHPTSTKIDLDIMQTNTQSSSKMTRITSRLASIRNIGEFVDFLRFRSFVRRYDERRVYGEERPIDDDLAAEFFGGALDAGLAPHADDARASQLEAG